MHAIYMEAATTDNLAVAVGMLSIALDLLHCWTMTLRPQRTRGSLWNCNWFRCRCKNLRDDLLHIGREWFSLNYGRLCPHVVQASPHSRRPSGRPPAKTYNTGRRQYWPSIDEEKKGKNKGKCEVRGGDESTSASHFNSRWSITVLSSTGRLLLLRLLLLLVAALKRSDELWMKSVTAITMDCRGGCDNGVPHRTAERLSGADADRVAGDRTSEFRERA